MRKFIDDYNRLKQDKKAFFDIKGVITLKRNNPIGNEIATHETKSRLSIKKLQPIIDLLSLEESSNEGTEQEKGNDRQNTILVENIFPKLLKLGDT